MTPEPYDPEIPSTGMTLDTDLGPVDIVAIERVRHGHPTRLTPAEDRHLDSGLTYNAELEQLVAEALGLRRLSVNRRINRARERAAKQAAAAPLEGPGADPLVTLSSAPAAERLRSPRQANGTARQPGPRPAAGPRTRPPAPCGAPRGRPAPQTTYRTRHRPVQTSYRSRSMTGPEHYAEAERLLHLAKTRTSHGRQENADVVAQAQAHATLALAAAMGTYGLSDETRAPADANAWEHVAGEWTAQKRRQADNAEAPADGA